MRSALFRGPMALSRRPAMRSSLISAGALAGPRPGPPPPPPPHQTLPPPRDPPPGRGRSRGRGEGGGGGSASATQVGPSLRDSSSPRRRPGDASMIEPALGLIDYSSIAAGLQAAAAVVK